MLSPMHVASIRLSIYHCFKQWGQNVKQTTTLIDFVIYESLGQLMCQPVCPHIRVK